MIIHYTVPEIWCVTDVIFFHFGPFLPFYSPNSPKNQNFEKLKKIPGDIIILHSCTKNYDQMMYGSWDTLCDRRTERWMDERTDRWMEKVTNRGGCLNVGACLNANKISLNVKKTELLIFKHQRKKLDSPIKIKLSRKRLYPSKSFKYFGIKIDEKLN